MAVPTSCGKLTESSSWLRNGSCTTGRYIVSSCGSGLGGIGCPASSIGALNDARTSAGIGGRLKTRASSSV